MEDKYGKALGKMDGLKHTTVFSWIELKNKSQQQNYSNDSLDDSELDEVDHNEFYVKGREEKPTKESEPDSSVGDAICVGTSFQQEIEMREVNVSDISNEGK